MISKNQAAKSECIYNCTKEYDPICAKLAKMDQPVIYQTFTSLCMFNYRQCTQAISLDWTIVYYSVACVCKNNKYN